MVKILDKTKDSIIVKLPASLERHILSLSRGFDCLSAAEKRSVAAIKKSISKTGYASHEQLLKKYALK